MKDITDHSMKHLEVMASVKVVSVVGYKNSGKTRVVEALVSELTKRGYRVGTLKHTAENVLLDTPGKDTWRHREAGSIATAILHSKASALFIDKPLMAKEAISMLGKLDFVITEGFKSLGNVAKIVVPREKDEVKKLSSGLEIAVVDINGRGFSNLGGLAAIPFEKLEDLADLVEKMAFPILPGLDCGSCNYDDCLGFGRALIARETSLERCVGFLPDFGLRVDGENILLGAFVQEVTRNVILGLVRSFKGIESPQRVEINFKVDNDD